MGLRGGAARRVPAAGTASKTCSAPTSTGCSTPPGRPCTATSWLPARALGGIALDADGDWEALHHALPGRPGRRDQPDALETLAGARSARAPTDAAGCPAKPDRLAAFVVADRLLQRAPRQRLTYERATAGLPEPRRQRLRPVLAEAVRMTGAGRDLLLGLLKHAPWPPEFGAGAWHWYLTLSEAEEVARAAPDEALGLLDAFVAAWPLPTSHERHGTTTGRGHPPSRDKARCRHRRSGGTGSVPPPPRPVPPGGIGRTASRRSHDGAARRPQRRRRRLAPRPARGVALRCSSSVVRCGRLDAGPSRDDPPRLPAAAAGGPDPR